MNIPFVGPTYSGRSANVDASRSVNLYPEVAAPGAKSPVALVGTPGTVLFSSTGGLPIRGMHAFGGLLYAVSGGKLHSVTPAGLVSDALGQLETSTGRVLMADNGIAASGVGGNQLMITDGVAGYIYDVETGVFTTISGGGWPPSGASALAYIDGYFVVGATGSMSAHASDLYDGTSWNALAASPVSAAPDLIMAVANVHQQLWVIKEYTSEVWYDASVPTSQGFPFARVPGAVIDYGTAAPASVARGGNALYFLANQRNNDGGEFVGVVALSGYTPQVVSPPAVTYRMGGYPLADAFGYCYSDGGHTFYVVTFPAGDATWAYDASTGMWHERSTYKGQAYAVGRHVGNCYACLGGRHLVGDHASGNIYEMRSDAYTDAGAPLVSVRTCQHIFDGANGSNVFIRRLHVDMETGGVDGGAGLVPSAALSWSDDGGHTWSNEYTASMGAAGAYRARAVWRRLGVSRDRIFRLSVSDPVRRIIIAAYAE